MSDDWIILIPEDPEFVPDASNRKNAEELFTKIAPDAEQIATETFEDLKFFDCGSNFERIRCPSCNSEISTKWWTTQMDVAFKDGFKLEKQPVPCCHSLHTLHELVYEWLQGFGRFSMSAMNPNIGKLSDKDKRAMEEILGTKLRIIYRHI